MLGSGTQEESGMKICKILELLTEIIKAFISEGINYQGESIE